MSIRLKRDLIPTLVLPFDYFELSQNNRDIISSLLENSSGKAKLWCVGAIDNDAKKYLKERNILFREHFTLAH